MQVLNIENPNEKVLALMRHFMLPFIVQTFPVYRPLPITITHHRYRTCSLFKVNGTVTRKNAVLCIAAAAGVLH